MAQIESVFVQHALASYDKQYRLAEIVQQKQWNADLQNGLLKFGKEMSFPIQVIGSQSEYDNTWLWAWANNESGLNPSLLKASQELRKVGQELELAELVTDKFTIGAYDGHSISMIASGLCKASCYYRAPYDGGAAFLLIPRAKEVDDIADLSAHYIVSRIMDYICMREINQKEAIEAYLGYKGYTFSYEGNRLNASSSQGQRLTAEYDGSDRVIKMETVLSPPIKKTPWWKIF